MRRCRPLRVRCNKHQEEAVYQCQATAREILITGLISKSQSDSEFPGGRLADEMRITRRVEAGGLIKGQSSAGVN